MTTAHQAGIVPVLTEGQRLMVAREYVNLTQGDLAERLGVTTATVQRAESGKTQPRKTTFMAWAMATGVNLHWLQTGENPHPVNPDGGKGYANGDSNPEPAGSAKVLLFSRNATQRPMLPARKLVAA